MRPLAVPVMLALGSVACGVISGLGAYSVGPGDAPVSVNPGDDAAMVVHPGDGDSQGSGSDDTGELTMDDGPPDNVDDAESEAEPTSDAEPAGDAAPESGTNDAGVVHDAGTTPQHDAAVVEAGPPPCSPATCGGCCSSGTCVGGLSNGTCGTGGEACKSCSGSTPSCMSGSCEAEPVEASAPTCSQSVCIATTLCIPVYEVGCCKADNTCGCEIAIPPSNNCQ